METAELSIDGRVYRGFALILREVLEELGVPAECLVYLCRGKPTPDGGLEGHVVINLKVPASETVPERHAFTELEVETSIDACVHSVSHSALRRVMRDAYERLKGGRFRLLPPALDLSQSTRKQLAAIDLAVLTEKDPYLVTSGLYILEVEQRNHYYRNILFEANESFLKMEQKAALRKAMFDLPHDSASSVRTSTRRG